MSLWIKICANTSLEDARVAAEAGADAVGFVFAPSPRRVTVDQVRAISPRLPKSVEKIGVFVDHSLDEVVRLVRACSLTGVQLHAGFSTDATARLRAEFGPQLRILRVLHFGPQAAQQILSHAKDRNISAILVDSRTPSALGGTGISFDWESAAATIFTRNQSLKLIAAGGLHPENVADAIATLQPWGIDVASGVESAPGHKDHALVRDFIASARRASEQSAHRRA